MKHPFSKNRQAGVTLVDGLVSMGLLGIALVVFAHYGRTLMSSRASTDLLKQRILIKNMLLNSVSCDSIPACKTGEDRDLMDIEAKYLVKKDGSSTYGPWQVRARCQADQTLEVRVEARVAGKARPDPMTRKPLDYANPSSILIPAGVLCGPITDEKGGNSIFPVTSRRCTVNQGSCPPPEKARGIEGAPKRMCCESGSDVPKPMCPVPAREIGAYWDREEDWGAEGKWVVLCQQ